MRYIFLAIYYLFLRYLPEGYHHRYLKWFNTLRSCLGKFFFASCGQNITIHRKASFGTGRNLSIGNNSNLGVNCYINARGGVAIGEHVLMGPDVSIYTGTHTYKLLDIPIQKQPMKYAAVVIGNDVWIGTRVIILPGVTIGNGCVIGACSVVSKDIPPYSDAVGVPIRIIKDRRE